VEDTEDAPVKRAKLSSDEPNEQDICMSAVSLRYFSNQVVLIPSSSGRDCAGKMLLPKFWRIALRDLS
jgi:hypothetical protein